MSLPPRAEGQLAARAEESRIARRVLLPTQAFIYMEGATAWLLLAGAILALGLANSPWQGAYEAFWHTPLTFEAGPFRLSHDLRHWVNDGLMALFFFLVGLEVKRELVDGELSEWRKAALPLAAALGGMVVPALLYVALNFGGTAMRGWGIPMATDIAFALGILGLVGKGLPTQVRALLLGLAVVDDLGAILVIAVFYSSNISWIALGAGAGLLAVMLLIQRLDVRSLSVYVVLGVFFWLAVLQSGVHATLAGVILGLITPADPYMSRDRLTDTAERFLQEEEEAHQRGEEERAERSLGQLEELVRESEAPLERQERLWHPWVGYGVLPIFALANAGIPLNWAEARQALTDPVFLGIALGLVVGKPLGILGSAWVALKTGIARLPEGVTLLHICGIGVVAGIGFTVSLFIANLAFGEGGELNTAKLAILVGSIAAGLLGYVFFRVTHQEEPERQGPAGRRSARRSAPSEGA